MPSVEDSGGAVSDDGKVRFAGRCPRKIKLGPEDPRSNALIFGKRGVGAFDGRARGRFLRIFHQKNGARFGVAAAFEWNDHAIHYAGLFANGSFEVLGIDVETGRCDDHVFFAPAESQVALGVEFAQVAGAQPALLLRGPESSLFPVAAGNIFTADENFAVFGELKLTAREDFADRSFRRAKRMIQTDQRSRLRHAVALNNGITHALEEVLGFIQKRRATGDHRPKLPPKTAMNAAKHPYAL